MSNSTSTTGEARGQARRADDTFTRDQFVWLRQVAVDGDLPPASARIAIALTRYFHREDGCAWMSQATLAHDLGMPQRTVRFALSRLVNRGHLVSKRRGQMQTNTYRISLKISECDRQSTADHDGQHVADHDRQDAAAQPGVTGKITQGDRQLITGMTGNRLPLNPYTEPLEEPNLEIDSPQTDLGANVDADFEAWWIQFPKKVDKAKARNAYRKVRNKGTATTDQPLTGAMRYAAERSGLDPKFTKYPSTWLAAESWANEAESSFIPPASVAGGHSPFGRHFEQALADARAIEGGLQ